MHLAICVWGLLRSLAATIHGIHEYCLDPILNSGHTYEIFLHTYHFSGDYTNKRSHETAVHLNFTEWKLLHPDHVIFEDQDKFDRVVGFEDYMSKGDPWVNGFASFKNHVRALNSLWQITTAVEKSGGRSRFDGIVFMRPDMEYISEIPIDLLTSFPRTLFIPDFHRLCNGVEYNDRFAMGDYDSGIVLGKKFAAAFNYSLVHQLHSETFTHDYLKEKKVNTVEIPFRFRRVRANGKIEGRDTHLLTPAEQYNLVSQNRTPEHDWEYQFCRPHPHLEYKDIENIRAQALETVQSKLNKSTIAQWRAAKEGVMPAFIEPYPFMHVHYYPNGTYCCNGQPPSSQTDTHTNDKSNGSSAKTSIVRAVRKLLGFSI